MKFKTKEELIKENTGDGFWKGCIDSHDDAIKDGINKAFNSFKERIDLYKDYSAKNMTGIEDRDNLRKENPDVFDVWFYSDEHKEYASSIGGEGKLDNVKCNELYNKWLYNFCFGDIK